MKLSQIKNFNYHKFNIMNTTERTWVPQMESSGRMCLVPKGHRLCPQREIKAPRQAILRTSPPSPCQARNMAHAMQTDLSCLRAAKQFRRTPDHTA